MVKQGTGPVDAQDIKEVEQLHAELAEKDAEIISLMDVIAELIQEKQAALGQIIRMQSDRECVD